MGWVIALESKGSPQSAQRPQRKVPVRARTEISDAWSLTRRIFLRLSPVISVPSVVKSFLSCGRQPCRMLSVFLPLLIALTAAAQQVGQNAPLEGNGTTIIRSSTQLVVEAVVVKDKRGNPIKGLTAKDFTVTENTRNCRSP